ncbi:hypothetical protein [uncultured Dokdonia sp.]|uniref:hypothetical protein n=1 Tax=uncultured Dokdonia sp. TaxID=575653 RepID=UPI0026031163|nr:hypothetical protein [uncultured Dokdonia sp.]
MKITFDSNTWRKIASPKNFPKDPFKKAYFEINKSIRLGKIEAYLSETIFTLEAVKRVERKSFFRTYSPKKTYNISEKNGIVNISASIAPDPKLHPGNNEFLNEHLNDALNLGFKIINIPRIGTSVNPDIEGKKIDLHNVNVEKLAIVSGRIEELKAGLYDIKKIGEKYYPNSWFIGVGKAPDSENQKIASAVAEWADGDSVAAHIGLNGDYFCTNDSAKKAGSTSVLSIENTRILHEEFNFKKITPLELSELI